jgi:hypothetical protein
MAEIIEKDLCFKITGCCYKTHNKSLDAFAVNDNTATN